MLKKTAESKRDLFMLRPEALTLVYDKEHPLYDPRVEDDPPENMILNIMMNGVLQPINVRVNGDKIEVVAGRGRTKSTIEANRRLVAEGKPPLLIPCINKGGSDADLFGVMVSENEIRREDNMIVKGIKARKLLNLGYSVHQIAVTFGVTRQAVENWLATDELPQEIKDAVESGETTATAALEMAGAGHSKEEQVKRFNDLKEKGVKATTENVKAAAASSKNQPATKMKSRKEIVKTIEEQNAILAKVASEYDLGYLDALRWVVGNTDDID